MAIFIDREGQRIGGSKRGKERRSSFENKRNEPRKIHLFRVDEWKSLKFQRRASQPASQPPSQTAYGEYGEDRGEHEERGWWKFCTLVRKGGCSREKHREAGSRDKGGRLPHRPARVPFPYTVINEPIPEIKQPAIKVTEFPAKAKAFSNQRIISNLWIRCSADNSSTVI